MVKKSKRKQDIKSKLVAAVAMLMVATIMMVSSTYAWFTLSTAPEIQGITTNVGANGNLEIALSPASGKESDVKSEVGDALLGWLEKNLTWGNLLDMSDPSYGLGEITLLPSRLNMTVAEDGTATLGGNPLSIPVFGSDGRISKLDASGISTGTKGTSGAVSGFLVNTSTNTLYGVRAIGTSSTMSPTQKNFQNALNAINTYRVAAQKNAKLALDDNGHALAAIAIKMAAGTTTGFEAHKADIANMVTMLTEADKAAEQALYNALLALANTAVVKQYETDNDVTTPYYTQLQDAIAANTPLTNFATLIADLDALKDSNGVSYVSGLKAGYDAWVAIHGDVASLTAAYTAIENEAAWTDTQVKTVLQYLMETSGDVTIGGYTIAQVKENPFVLASSLTDLTLRLGSGSGLFYDFAQLTGTISSSVTMPANTTLTYDGKDMDLSGMTITISAAEPEAGPYLKVIRNTTSKLPAATDDTQASTIDVTYGYAIDLLLRTNVANSDLLLQVDGAQRIYGDSSNEDTMGKGSSMTFTGTYDGLKDVIDLMEGVRVVFVDTKADTDNVLGVAKLTDYEVSYVKEGVTYTAKIDKFETDVGNGSIYPVFSNPTEGFSAIDAENATSLSVTGSLKLHSFTQAEADTKGVGKLTLGEAKEVQTLCSMPQNLAKAITAMVYLDGDYVNNSDVSNSETGVSLTGTMNLQFASSAELVPMENTDLFNGTEPAGN